MRKIVEMNIDHIVNFHLYVQKKREKKTRKLIMIETNQGRVNAKIARKKSDIFVKDILHL